MGSEGVREAVWTEDGERVKKGGVLCLLLVRFDGGDLSVANILRKSDSTVLILSTQHLQL